MFEDNLQYEELPPVVHKDCFADIESVRSLIDSWFPDNQLSTILTDLDIGIYVTRGLYLAKLGVQPSELNENFIKNAVHYFITNMKMIFDYETNESNKQQIDFLDEYAKPIIEDVEHTEDEIPLEYVRIPTPRSESKLTKAKAIYQSNKHLTRKELVNLFIVELEMNPSSASTYYYLAQK